MIINKRKKCSECIYYSSHMETSKLIYLNKLCKKYPKSIKKEKYDWCGEFKKIYIIWFPKWIVKYIN